MIASATISSISVKPLRACNFPRNGSPFFFVFVPAPPAFPVLGHTPNYTFSRAVFQCYHRKTPAFFQKFIQPGALYSSNSIFSASSGVVTPSRTRSSASSRSVRMPCAWRA